VWCVCVYCVCVCMGCVCVVCICLGLDGWPGYIEEDLDRWFQNTYGDENHGHIGLWGYSVVAEVEADDVK